MLDQHGGVWKFDEAAADQTQATGEHYATGMRQNFAMAWHPAEGGLYLVQHGGDQLNTLWARSVYRRAETPSCRRRSS